MDDFQIRPQNPQDASGICEVHIASIRILNGPFYSSEQIETWAGRCRPDRYEVVDRLGEGHFVAEKDGRIVGFSNVKGAELTGCYVSPLAVGRGIGSGLCAAAEAWALGQGHVELNCSSSLQAVGFYLKRGFKKIGEKRFMLNQEVGLESISMRKRLR